MAYVTRPALLPSDFGYSLKEEKPNPTKPKTAPKKKVKAPKKKLDKKPVVKKAVGKVVKKGRKLPWKV